MMLPKEYLFFGNNDTDDKFSHLTQNDMVHTRATVTILLLKPQTTVYK